MMAVSTCGSFGFIEILLQYSKEAAYAISKAALDQFTQILAMGKKT